ncbi:MAG: ABC transporter permease subunit [Anaerolineae bacterium]|nr:ABC transporter permease subunit [Anaerolineae bacterium]MCI0609891.1 ABC transporter permease subunit [Anaerolineae bacterium]
MKKNLIWSWFWIILSLLYFFVPLILTFVFSLQTLKDQFSFISYQRVFEDRGFIRSLIFSTEIGIVTIFLSLALMIPTVYWVRLKAPRIRPVIEFISLLPFVIPAIVLVFGLIRVFSGGLLPLTNTHLGTNFLLVAAYVVIGFPYLYRSIDAGMGAIDVVTLTEAAQSLGANWFTIMFRVIIPNLRAAIFSATFLTLAIVMGEFTVATFLVGLKSFGPYLWQVNQNRAYEGSALVIVSFLITWAFMGLIVLVGRGAGASDAAGPR